MEREFAQILLQHGLVKINFENLFTYTSGKKGPIYCDNRQLISLVPERKLAIAGLKSMLPKGEEFHAVAALATAGIAFGAWLAESMQLPLVYIRSEAKNYGQKRQLEGRISPKARVVLLDDVINQGGNILHGEEVLRQEGCVVAAMLCLFHYQTENFRRRHLEICPSVPVFSLTTFEVLVDVALEEKRISSEEREILLAQKNA